MLHDEKMSRFKSSNTLLAPVQSQKFDGKTHFRILTKKLLYNKDFTKPPLLSKLQSYCGTIWFG